VVSVRGGRTTLVAVLLVALAGLVVGQLGFFVRVEKRGGWTGQTTEVDFSPRERRLVANAPAGDVDNVILLLADGLGFAQVTAARAELVGINGLLTFERFPVRSWLDTHALDSVYSDSAAGATALASGHKTRPRRVGVDADGQPLLSLFGAAEAAGRATGWLTDSFFFDATPAAYAARSVERKDYAGIVRQIAAGDSDLVLGELSTDYPEDEKRRQEMVALFAEAGWRIASSWPEIEAAADEPQERLAGIFPPGTIAADERPPLLVDLFDAALDRLGSHPAGFVLLAEVEDPDSGAHDGDFRQVLRGIRHLEELAARALAFALRNGRTLVIVTSDHETGGLALVDGGPDKRLGLRWATISHTGVPVPLYAWGPGAEALEAVRDNTDVAPIVAGLADLELLPAPILGSGAQPSRSSPGSRIGSPGGSD
jgi:alkaline phosphatase